MTMPTSPGQKCPQIIVGNADRAPKTVCDQFTACDPAADGAGRDVQRVRDLLHRVEFSQRALMQAAARFLLKGGRVSKRLRCTPVERRCCSRQPITVLPVSACAPIPGHLLTCRAIFSAATLLSSPSFIRTSSMAAASALRRSFFFFVRHRLFREEPRPASPLKVFEGLCNLHERSSVLCRPTSPFDEPRHRGTRQY